MKNGSSLNLFNFDEKNISTTDEILDVSKNQSTDNVLQYVNDIISFEDENKNHITKGIEVQKNHEQNNSNQVNEIIKIPTAETKVNEKTVDRDKEEYNIGVYNDEKESQAREYAEKAQKAAIMARNMSHNLGSHVMAYLKQQLNTTESILSSNDRVLYDIYRGNGKVEKDISDTIQLPFLVGLGQFINYLQERQDYIATVATSYIPYPAPIDFKEAIFDGINPDLRWLRHKKNKKNKPFNILLNYIAKSEGYTRQPIYDETISLNGRYLQINYVNYDLKADKIEKIDGFKTGDMESAKGLNSTILAVPGGLIGRQAVFSIIENITRNAAKHEKISNENLEINIGLMDGAKLQEYYKKEWLSYDIYECYKETADIENLFLFLITYKTNTNDEKTLKKDLWKGINDNYVAGVYKKDESKKYAFIETNKGIKEIRISASWLRGNTNEGCYRKCWYSNEDDKIRRIIVDSDKERKTLSPLVYVDITDGEYAGIPQKDVKCLRYIIGIKKQLGVKVIKEKGSKSEINIISDETLRDWKIVECTEEFFAETIKDDGCYEFVVVENNDIYKKIRPYLSNRTIRWNDCKKYAKLLEEKIKTISQDCEEEVCKTKKAEIILEMLYSVYAQVEWDEEIKDSQKINIWDNETHLIVDDKIPFCFNKGINIVEGDSGIGEFKYIYRTHHEQQAQDFIKENFINKKNVSFKDVRVEGISGSNSTARLIRYASEFNYIWYCKHRHALSQNIAIIDERIFESVTGISENDFSESRNDEWGIMKKVADSKNFEEDFIKLIGEEEDLFNKYPELTKVANKNQFDIFLESIDVSKRTSKNIFDGNKTSLAVILSQKGLWVYNIISETLKDEMYIVGYYHDIEREKTYTVKIATIICDKTNKSISIILNEDEYFNKILSNPQFHKICIHQGLLDKIYKMADCVEENNKIAITKEIHDFFLGKTPNEENNIEGLYIHSGRSKPAKEYMPQQVPFIQYSAIDFAVHDSKYTLTELLDFAKYEE